MSPGEPPSRLPRWVRAVLAAARRMVPRHHRDDWSREWSAELDTLWRPDPGRVPDGGGLALRRIRRTFLAVRDAVGIGAREVRLERALEEVRQAGRSVRRHPGASLGFAALLAAAVCATTLVAAVVHGVLRRPLPYPEPDRVVLVTPARPDGRGSGGHVSAAELLEVRRRARSLDVVGGVQHVSATLLDRGPPAEIPGARVSADALEALGVPAEHGRVFGPGEDGPGGPPVVLLSHGLWRGPFGGDPSIVGREVRLDGDGYTVLGVMPADFVLPTEVGASGSSAFFLPLAVDPADPGPVFVKELDGLVARLRPGVGLAAADADVGRVAGEIEAAHPENYRPGEWTLRARSPLARAVADARPVLAAVGLAVAFLLLALGANLVGLLASSGERRRGEMAVRRALGAGRLQLVRRLVTESLVLGVLAAPVGVGVAAACLPWIRAALADVLPRMGDVEVGPVAGWVLAATLAASVLLSLAPALRATTRVSAVSRAGRGGAGPPRAAARRWLMGGQLAVATVLLSGSVLFARSLANLLAVDPGFRASGVRLAELSLPSWRYQSAAEIEDFYRRLVEVMRDAPGVEDAGLVRRRPMADRYGTWTVAIRGGGEPRRLDDDPPRWQVVTPGYFHALSVDVEEGRLFTDAELTGEAGVALVNRAFSDRYWPDRGALGSEIRMDGGDDNPWLTVVGVVADVRIEGPRAPPAPVLYVPHPHFAAATSVGSQRRMTLVLRTRLDVGSTRTLLESRLAALDPELPHGSLGSMDEIVAASVADTRMLARVLTLFSTATLLLGALGVYGALAWEVSARSREIGIRAALGAGRRRLLGEVLREGLVVAVVGTSVGLVVAVGLADPVASYLFGIDGRDPPTLAGVTLVLLAAAAGASYVPARRAAAVDPVVPLRAE